MRSGEDSDFVPTIATLSSGLTVARSRRRHHHSCCVAASPVGRFAGRQGVHSCAAALVSLRGGRRTTGLKSGCLLPSFPHLCFPHLECHRWLRHEGKTTSVSSDFCQACPGRNHNWPATGEGNARIPSLTFLPTCEASRKESQGSEVMRDPISCRSAGTSPAEAEGGKKSSEHQIPILFCPRS